MRENEKLAQEVRGVVAEALGVSESSIKEDMQYGDLLAWDSLGHIDIMAALEDKYGIDIVCTEVRELIDIPAIIGWVEQVMEERVNNRNRY